MTTTVLEKTTDQIAETVEKASRATAKMGDVLHERFEQARLAAKRGAHATEEFVDETRHQIRRHPVESVTATFIIGMAVGTLFGWLMRRK